jgi:hypothetical protein
MPRYQYPAAVYYTGTRTVTRTKQRRKIKLRKRAVRRVKLLVAALVDLVFLLVCSYAVIFAFMAMFVFWG